ncbi:hypothetical protein BKA93DRAFT_805330 [Sparassis latifolia]
MAVAKSKFTPNGAGKQTKPTLSTDAITTSASPTSESTPTSAVYGHGKPEKAIYEREQEQIKTEIDALQVKLSAVKDKLASAGRGGPSSDRRNALRAELDSVRGQQSTGKASRGKILDQLKSLQDNIQKKIKDLNTAKAKIPYRSVAEVDERIRQLEKQVESGNLKLVEEKRALAEISQCKRSRRAVEGFQAEQDSIEADRAVAEELRRELEDPEAKAASERYDAIRAELDEIKKEGDEAYAHRSKLLDERTALQGQLDVLYNQKRDSAQRFREANDKYWYKVNEDRARRAERQRAQRAAEEEAKKKELADRLREEADAPAFQSNIEDCQTLIDFFFGKTSATPSSPTPVKTDLEGVPQLELRTVEGSTDGLVVRKKKGEDEQLYFVSSKGKKSKKTHHGGPKAIALSEGNSSDASGSQNQVHVPLPTLSALLSLSISPPTSPADLLRVVEDLKIKKAWFEANQARVTAENKEKAEAQIRRLTGKIDSKGDAPSPAVEVTSSNGGGERPPEPAPTPATAPPPSIDVPSEDVAEELEIVEEQPNGEVKGEAQE